VAFEDRAKPKLRDHHDVIVHVSQTGICGSDVSFSSASDGNNWSYYLTLSRSISKTVPSSKLIVIRS
jgi:D-arabinose 1-dehydrogenase-like Zn-dependent alcohol dehydrogenase